VNKACNPARSFSEAIRPHASPSWTFGIHGAGTYGRKIGVQPIEHDAAQCVIHE